MFRTDIINNRNTRDNAELINRKLTLLLFGLPISDNDNLDIITFNNSKHHTDRFVNNFDNFIRLNINKLTGITYTEFNNMSVIEMNTLIDFVNFKMEVSDIDVLNMNNIEEE